ncbi:MAG: protein-glutamate O-methyltransferase [Sedimenticola sp.]
MDITPDHSHLLSEQEYQDFRHFLEQACGIVLGPGKEYLVASRLSRLMHERGFENVGELLKQLDPAVTSPLKIAVIDAMTTNETYWFRDGAHFQLLKQRVLPELCAARRGRIRLWSAACSSGQEPYSISMTLNEFEQDSTPSLRNGVEILATDISHSMLKIAREGQYCGFSAARGLSHQQRERYFEQHGACITLREEVRRRVVFQEMNLTRQLDSLGRFDVIFCRNVLIYFSPQQKQEILSQLTRSLNPGGYLFLGSTESLSGLSDHFEMIKTTGGIAYRLSD